MSKKGLSGLVDFLRSTTQVVEGITQVGDALTGQGPAPADSPPVPENASPLVRVAMGLDEMGARMKPGASQIQDGLEGLDRLGITGKRTKKKP